MAINLLIACGDSRLAHAMHSGLEQQDPTGINSELADLEHVLESASRMQPDVLLLENSLAGESTHQLVSLVGRVSRFTRTLMLYDTCTDDLIIESIQQGASGCVLKSSPPWLLAKAVHSVFHGDAWYGRMALLQALQSQVCRSTSANEVEEHRLTPREEEILHLIGCGMSNKEIGRQLEISDKTVKTHLHRVYVKLNRSGRFKAFLAQPEARAQASWTPMK
ncbi:LuxR C-terminal-related transcriptional regulator [Caenimonas soli]|uniref:LuxR C-terminal-related transcriptional regulator n=1 Tax=Caenimonas soli TaxID=2735555 RepID=UPI0015545417|nr:response regulator transcription factor [Caenimonas soli]NPC58651.1 response regulator transcription factor [Caenimonas soli]